MKLRDRIRQETTEAMKAKDSLRLSVLRMLTSSLDSKEKDKLYEASKQGKEAEGLTDEEVMSVVATEAKKRREAADAFEKGNRQELADKEKEELTFLAAYLPSQLTEEEVKTEVAKAVKAVGASGPQDMGKVMSHLTETLKGKADGSLVNRIVKEHLS